MTGFGSSEATIEGVVIKTEIKTLNSKFFDLNIKLPRELASKEPEIRLLLQNGLKRGKANVLIEITSDQVQPTEINEELLKAYFDRYKKIGNSLGTQTQDLFKLALHSPDVMVANQEEFNIDWQEVSKAIQEAITTCEDFRLQEGEKLKTNLTGYIQNIDQSLTQIGGLDEKRVAGIRERIGKNLDEIRERVQVDENRFEQELIYYVEKLDITEEKVRLKNHLDYFLEVLDSKTSEGKKLGFISQEIGREINTLGSKANDSEIQQLVVQMKDELEKIKEQLLNIL